MEPFTVVLWAPLQHIERARHLMCIPQVNSIYVDFDRDNDRRRECQNSKEKYKEQKNRSVTGLAGMSLLPYKKVSKG